MKILLCGDRFWTDRESIRLTLAEYAKKPGGPHVLIHGAARGADRIGGEIAAELGFDVVAVPAEWARYGRTAGPIRNSVMLAMQPDVVLAFHADLGRSRGTKDTLMKAYKAGIPLHRVTGTSSSL